VTEAEQQLAAERESGTAAVREQARQAVEAGRRHLAAVEALTGGADAETAMAGLSEAQSRLSQANRAAAKVQKLTAELAGLVTKLESARSRLEAATDTASAVREELATLDGHRTDLRERVEEARGEEASVQRRHARVTAAVEALAEHEEAARALREAQARARRAGEAADQAARAAGFPDHEQAAAAALPDHERTELAEVTADHDARLSRVIAILEELPPTTEDLPDTLAETLRIAFESARAAHRAAQEHHTLATRSAQALTRLAADLETHARQTAPLRTSFISLEAVSRCVEGTGGDNQLRMRLSSYVLAARLEQVAQAASVRLAAMSGGRYELVHTDGPARAGARSGLGLAVVDGWTGVQRDPGTLSGGETFCTSLALALGLADVVQAEAGGAIIETLLVDEGFGSLDEDTLEEVMDVLDGLRSGGRAVGLVSHVADLRDRIPAQLEVVKTRTGSRLRMGAPALTA
jgi:exonuclease SbcC